MLKHMACSTYLDWMRYAALEPFDQQRADLRAGIIASTIVNVAMGLTGSKGRLTTPSDFMPFSSEPEPPRQTADQLYQKIRVLNRLLGGRVIDERKPREVA